MSFWNEIVQVGLVVKDVDYYTKKYWDEYKIGPWDVYIFGGATHVETFVRDEPTNYSMKIALAYSGNTVIELIEPLDDKSIYAEFLKERGDGLHHIQIGGVDNVNETIENLKSQGVNILQTGNMNGRRYTYMDTERDLGVIIEFLEANGPRPHPEYSYPSKDVDVDSIKEKAYKDGEALDWKSVTQVSFIVKDLDKCVKTYADKYGLGSWEVYKFGGVDHANTFVRGKKTDYEMKVALTSVNGMQIELIEPLDEKSIYAEFIRKKGEGFHDIHFAGLKHVDHVISFLNKKNIDILQEGIYHGVHYSYMDSEIDLSAIIGFVNKQVSWPEPDYVYPE
jgi:methylmalonyl-CoA/ethylmalonyl-CoA epimerase